MVYLRYRWSIGIKAIGRDILGVYAPGQALGFELVGEVFPGEVMDLVVLHTLRRTAEQREVIGLAGVRHAIGLREQHAALRERIDRALEAVERVRRAPQLLDDGEDELERQNARLLEAVNRTGEVFLSHTKLDGRFSLRLAIGHIRTTERHVARAWELLQSQAHLLGGEIGK